MGEKQEISYQQTLDAQKQEKIVDIEEKQREAIAKGSEDFQSYIRQTADSIKKELSLKAQYEMWKASFEALRYSLTTVEKDNVLTSMPIGRHPNAFKDKLPFRYYSLTEYCRLQTVPETYFSGITSDSQAKKMIGNGWTVDIIAHIFKNLK